MGCSISLIASGPAGSSQRAGYHPGREDAETDAGGESSCTHHHLVIPFTRYQSLVMPLRQLIHCLPKVRLCLPSPARLSLRAAPASIRGAVRRRLPLHSVLLWSLVVSLYGSCSSTPTPPPSQTASARGHLLNYSSSGAIYAGSNCQQSNAYAPRGRRAGPRSAWRSR